MATVFLFILHNAINTKIHKIILCTCQIDSKLCLLLEPICITHLFLLTLLKNNQGGIILHIKSTAIQGSIKFPFLNFDRCVKLF